MSLRQPSKSGAQPSGVKVSLSEQEFAELMRPRLMLFFSVDVVGSTALKQHRHRNTWLPMIATFLTSFGSVLERSSGAEAPQFRRASLWKVLGDELIFAAEILHRDEIRAHISTLVNAVRDWNREARERNAALVKASAWLAGFPVGNVILPLENGGADYIGPSMDAGFRLSKLATQAVLPLSVELAWMMLGSDGGLEITFRGTCSLKGLPDLHGYPALVVSTSENRLLEMERALTATDSSNRELLKNYCAEFIKSSATPNFLPFIAGDASFTPDPGYAIEKEHAEQLFKATFVVTEGDGPVDVGSHGDDTDVADRIAKLNFENPENRQDKE